MMGDETDPQDHPAHNKPTATQHYAGDVISIPGLQGPGNDSRATEYATGIKKEPPVVSIGRPAIEGWAKRTQDRLNK